MNKGPICGRFMKKTRGQKSHATVPLKQTVAAEIRTIINTMEQEESGGIHCYIAGSIPPVTPRYGTIK
jgi:hypothetical protein